METQTPITLSLPPVDMSTDPLYHDWDYNRVIPQIPNAATKPPVTALPVTMLEKLTGKKLDAGVALALVIGFWLCVAAFIAWLFFRRR